MDYQLQRQKHTPMRTNIICIILLLSAANLGMAQQVNKGKQGRFLITNATIHTVTNGIINGDILIDGSTIVNVGEDLNDDSAIVIDGTDRRVYPGFIDSGCKVGLAEIGAVSLTQDHNELGTFTPHMEALTAVNPSSVHIPITRVNGVTTAFTVPGGGLFPGKGALIHMYGYTPESMSAGFQGHILSWPSSGRKHRWDKRSDDDIKKDQEKAQKKLNDFWQSVSAYAKMDNPDGYKPQLSTLSEVANGKAKLLVEVNKKEDILNAIKWVNDKEINAIFTGVAEGWRVADSLAKYDIPVITGPILDNPSRDSDRYDAPYTNAGKMQKAGVLVAIRTNESDNVRNLPFNAAFAANYGLGLEEAIKAITINPAKIFGVDDQIGSIETGKLANFFICDGDPFEMKTRISHVFINGFNIPVESRQTYLYDEFLDRDSGTKIKD